MEPRVEKAPAAAELMEIVYDELRAVAERYFRKQPAGFTLRPTDMVNEACLSIIQHANVEWQSPEHFRAIATRKIWQVVVDHLRERNAKKRGGQGIPGTTRRTGRRWRRVAFDTIAVEWREGSVDFLDLAEALEDLGAESRRLHDVVMLHWFGGLTYADTGNVLGISRSTVEKDFRYALAWLNRRLTGADAHGD